MEGHEQDKNNEHQETIIVEKDWLNSRRDADKELISGLEYQDELSHRASGITEIYHFF